MDVQELEGTLLVLLVFGLFALAAFLRILRASRILRTPGLANGARFLRKLDIAFSIPLLLMAIVVIGVMLLNLR